MLKEIFCTCIIPTVGRISLSRAVESVLSQTLPHPEFEVVVVNDSSKPLPDQPWHTSDKVRIIDTHQRERSVARNTGATIARGQFLHFLDDDDWITDDAYRHFHELSQRREAAWLYGMTQLLDRKLEPTIVLKHGLNGNHLLAAMAGEWIPLQASLIQKEAFLKVGGFNPSLAGPEDIDLLRRILLSGEIAETPHLTAYVIRGEEGSTTNYYRHAGESRRAREIILDTENTFARMRETAKDSFWKARLLRIYLTSVIWNLQHRQFSRAMSRASSSIAALWAAGFSVLRWSYWSSISGPYASPTFARGIEAWRRNQAEKK